MRVAYSRYEPVLFLGVTLGVYSLLGHSWWMQLQLFGGRTGRILKPCAGLSADCVCSEARKEQGLRTPVLLLGGDVGEGSRSYRFELFFSYLRFRAHRLRQSRTQ